jgi:hypothetical protein
LLAQVFPAARFSCARTSRGVLCFPVPLGGSHLRTWLLRRPVCFVFCAEERAQSFFLDFPLLPFVDFYFWIAGGLLQVEPGSFLNYQIKKSEFFLF